MGETPAMVPRPIAMDHHDHDEHAWQVGRYTAQLQDILRKQRQNPTMNRGRRHEIEGIIAFVLMETTSFYLLNSNGQSP